MNFDQFFYGTYLPKHRRPWTRYLHFIGSAGVLLFAVAFLVTWNWWLLIGLPACGYGFAWGSHFLVEHNWPETLAPPLGRWWGPSLESDFMMLGLWLIGDLWYHLDKSRRDYPELWQ